jgi:hypothetical protein
LGVFYGSCADSPIVLMAVAPACNKELTSSQTHLQVIILSELCGNNINKLLFSWRDSLKT